MADTEKQLSEVILCGHCRNRTLMHIVREFSQIETRGTDEFFWSEGYINEMLCCPVCSGITLRRYWCHEYMEPDDVTYEVLYPVDTTGTDSGTSQSERDGAMANRTSPGPGCGGKVFIGHGRSLEWLKLKDFLRDKLDLPCEEFSMEPTAGVSTGDRLKAMLDSACFAFLVATAEDKHADGTWHPRPNVIHEIGLFQNALGDKKAVILLEEGCQEFSNISGLGQIRFPPGNILAKTEEIRDVLLREGVLNPATQRGPAWAAGLGKVAEQPKEEVARLVRRQEVFWEMRGETITDGPFCPVCWEKDAKKIHMNETFVNGVADMDEVRHGGYMYF
jgi:hypothetical protein